ncbi:hypothetical protein A4D02_23305 [Niastella koreensis]|uniref:Uncharacterized protein n=1 Tax=Niastella koreensis TaxID=354356 RepID=A0ABX3P073_9BACT|nr:hypothetical protein A4D02_23305 [Niastella koreensis]
MVSITGISAKPVPFDKQHQVGGVFIFSQEKQVLVPFWPDKGLCRVIFINNLSHLDVLNLAIPA